MYTLKKSTRNEKTIKIYVNGKPLPYSWNNYRSLTHALLAVSKGNIVGCNLLTDDVEVVEESKLRYYVEYER